MPFRLRPRVNGAWLVLTAAIGITCAAVADDEQRTPRVPMLPLYLQECAACHVAYPPGMLPAVSWQRVMNDLPHHFGTDASLDTATVKELASWLNANAGAYKHASERPPEDRITRSAWFIREHDEVPAATWKLPVVRSASNCIACHTRADQGDFSERHVRIPH